MTKLRIPQSEKLIKKIRELISEQEANSFNKRYTGLNLQTFLMVFTINMCSMMTVTLEGLAMKCEDW